MHSTTGSCAALQCRRPVSANGARSSSGSGNQRWPRKQRVSTKAQSPAHILNGDGCKASAIWIYCSSHTGKPVPSRRCGPN